MKRYYLCPVLDIPDLDGGIRQVPKVYIHKFVNKVRCSYSAEIPTDPLTGKKLFDWCLVYIEAPDHAAFRADPQFTPLPDAVAMDGSLTLTDDMVNLLATMGIDAPKLTTLHGMLKRLFARLRPGVDIKVENIRAG